MSITHDFDEWLLFLIQLLLDNYLFTADPTESNNLASTEENQLEILKGKLDEYRFQVVPADSTADDPSGDPANFGGIWTPGWC